MSGRAIFLAGLVAVGSALCGLSCGDGSAPLKRVTLRLNWTFEGDQAGFYLARHAGDYAREGLDVEIVPGTGSATTVNLVGSGHCDFGYADAATVIRGVNSGASVRAVAVILQVSPMAVVFKSDRPILTAGDLRGRRIGVTSGDAPAQIFPAVLRANGIGPEELRVIALATPQAKERALLSGEVDAFLGYAFGQPVRLRVTEGVDLGILLFSEMGVNTLSNSVIVNGMTLEHSPELVRGFLRATQRGFARMASDPAGAVELLGEVVTGQGKEISRLQVDMACGLLHTSLSAGRAIGWSAAEDWRQTLTILKEYTDFDGDVAPATYYTNDLLSDVP